MSKEDAIEVMAVVVEPLPNAMLALPVLLCSALKPMATLLSATVLAKSAEAPTAVLLPPCVLLKSAC